LVSIYLTCFDIGASASGFISAAMVSALDIEAPEFNNLDTMIVMCATFFVATFAFVPTVRTADLWMKREE
jgi:hypothetical protein